MLFYFRYTKPDGTRDRVPLGEWEGSGGPLSLAAARERARELSARYRAGDRDLRAALEAEEREARRQREAAERAAQLEMERRQATLGALLTAYVDSLEARGKASAKAVRAAICRHVAKAWPRLWTTPADDLTADDLLSILTPLTDTGKLREAEKIRSYLQSAYSAGVKARTTASATPALRALRIRTNPTRDLGTIEGANKARSRALSATELRAYWRRISALPDRDGACLRFHLLTGGQRIEQLARATLADYDPDAGTLTLRDTKGRRPSARLHVVPLIPPAEDALHAMAPDRIGDYIFTATAGQSGMAASTAYARCRAVMEAMLAAGELPGGPFTIRDIRRTAETRLADLGFNSDVRAQLQSHGLGGVQARHYDRHDYLAEKRAALDALYNLVHESPSTVVPIRRERITRSA
ncbi:tyrosine-type recombinase/integrase [Luteimonas wenzhouensis]|uniref:Integrase family protein n=1 Tax=Luteimonas wenzhouensis TaxID=2599615 RepID=A0A5C5U1A1_9GAMM|nr:integrase family protein [Luteimonas wenzhouensis]TWT19797.1 integrase family protein [Luteimonas wenzhouensis]